MRILKLLGLAVLLISSTIIFAEQIQTQPKQEASEEKQALVVTSAQPEFTIKLKSNPTTGYSWFLRHYNHAIIQPISHQMEPSTDKKLMGAPGFEVWTFRVKPSAFIVPQQTTLRFSYARPWEFQDSSTDIVYQVTLAK